MGEEEGKGLPDTTDASFLKSSPEGQPLCLPLLPPPAPACSFHLSSQCRPQPRDVQLLAGGGSDLAWSWACALPPPMRSSLTSSAFDPGRLEQLQLEARKGSVVNVNPTNTRPHSDTPEIRKYKKRFNSEILCAALWGESQPGEASAMRPLSVAGCLGQPLCRGQLTLPPPCRLQG